MKLPRIPQPKCQYNHQTENNSQSSILAAFAVLSVIVLETSKNDTEKWVLL